MVLGPARGLGYRPAIGAGHGEFMAVDVDGVVGHGEVAETDAHLVVLADHQRVYAGEDAAVPAPDVEVQHGHGLGGVGTGIYVVGVEQEHKVAVHFVDQRVLGLGVGDPETHHAHGHLGHLVRMRVVHKCAGPPRYKLVNKGLAGIDSFLIQSRHAVHAIGQSLTVPVNTGVFGQFVGDEDAHAVALHHLYRGAGALAVVAPTNGP